MLKPYTYVGIDTNMAPPPETRVSASSRARPAPPHITQTTSSNQTTPIPGIATTSPTEAIGYVVIRCKERRLTCRLQMPTYSRAQHRLQHSTVHSSREPRAHKRALPNSERSSSGAGSPGGYRRFSNTRRTTKTRHYTLAQKCGHSRGCHRSASRTTPCTRSQPR